MKKFIIIAIMVFILSGCYTTKFQIKPNIQKMCQSVESRKIVTTGVGEVMFKECTCTTASVAIIKPSQILIECNDSKSSCKIFCDKSPNLHTESINCFRDCDNDGLFEVKFATWFYSEFSGKSYRYDYLTYDYDKPIPYLEQEITYNNEDSEYRLIYQGVGGSVLNISYREFSDNQIRPTFQQDLTYTLNSESPTEIAFKSVRIKVYSADNQSIRYEILSGLSE